MLIFHKFSFIAFYVVCVEIESTAKQLVGQEDKFITKGEAIDAVNKAIFYLGVDARSPRVLELASSILVYKRLSQKGTPV